MDIAKETEGMMLNSGRVVFHVDMDGTLWDAEFRNRSIIEREARNFSTSLMDMSDEDYGALWKDLWTVCAGKTENQIHGILGQKGFALDGITAMDFEDHCRNQWPKNLQDVHVNVGLLYFLTNEKLKGNKVGIVTSSREEDTRCYFTLAEQYVENADSVFDSVVSCDDVQPSNRKPQPHPYLLSFSNMTQMGVPQYHVGIEDSMNGAESFVAAFGNNPNAILFYLNPETGYQGDHPRVVSVKNVDELAAAYEKFLNQQATLGTGFRFAVNGLG